MVERLKVLLTFIGLAAIVGMSGCSRESSTAPDEGRQWTILSPELYVVTDADSLTLVAVEDSFLVFEMAGSEPQIARGQVVVGTEARGYLRKLLSMEIRGRQLFMRTASARLTDVVRFGRIDTVMTLGFSSGASGERAARVGAVGDDVDLAHGVSMSAGGLDLSGVVLYSGMADGESLTVTIPRGRIEFGPELSLGVEVYGRYVDNVHATVSGVIELTFDAAAAFSGALDFAREIPLASLSRTVVQRIGPLPVVETLTLSVSGGFMVASSSAGVCELGEARSTEATFGGRFRDRAWWQVYDFDVEHGSNASSYDSRGGAEITVFIKPRVEVAFYTVPSVSIDVEQGISLRKWDTGLPVLEWELSSTMRPVFSCDPTVLDRALASHLDRPDVPPALLASGPFKTDSFVFLMQWGSEGTLSGQFGYPKGIVVDHAGGVYVTDNWSNRVQKFSSEGDVLMTWGTSGTGPGQFNSPDGIALDGEGKLYVVDSGNNRIQKFLPESTFVNAWGSEGTGEGQFQAPAGIAILGQSVYVTDNMNNRVQRFSLDGGFLGAWGSFGTGEGQFDAPTGIAIDTLDQGQVLVTDCHNDRVQVFTPEGLFVRAWGSHGADGNQFDCPVDVTFAAGTVYVVDIGNDRFAEYSLDGTLKTTLGSHGIMEGQFDHPEGIGVDRLGNVYVVDGRNRRIVKFAPRLP